MDFDEGLTPQQRARSHALQRTCEEHLYWAQLYFRWTDHHLRLRDAYFAGLPRPIRDFVCALVHRPARRFLPYIERFDRRVFGRASVTAVPAADPQPALATATA